ncbi:hypothetical protein OH492_20050 [Vibrio chagasii]|nr:hypothetical protein [Vibrio chagasii]
MRFGTVDNAVVMVDTIQAYRLKGQHRSRSNHECAKALVGAVVGLNLITVLAFAPIILMPGIR